MGLNLCRGISVATQSGISVLGFFFFHTSIKEFIMKRSDIIHAALMTVCMIVLMFASTADAHASGYTISQKAAERYVASAAEEQYSQYDVTVLETDCSPQGISWPKSRWQRYTWHRWKCAWAGLDVDGDVVGGALRITGHSNGTYGYLTLMGIRWF